MDAERNKKGLLVTSWDNYKFLAAFLRKVRVGFRVTFRTAKITLGLWLCDSRLSLLTPSPTRHLQRLSATHLATSKARAVGLPPRVFYTARRHCNSVEIWATFTAILPTHSPRTIFLTEHRTKFCSLETWILFFSVLFIVVGLSSCSSREVAAACTCFPAFGFVSKLKRFPYRIKVTLA